MKKKPRYSIVRDSRTWEGGYTGDIQYTEDVWFIFKNGINIEGPFDFRWQAEDRLNEKETTARSQINSSKD